jgi:hypothetical protein
VPLKPLADGQGAFALSTKGFILSIGRTIVPVFFNSTGPYNQAMKPYRTLNKTGFLPAAIAAGFLLLAVFSHWPYSFYVLMRLTVCGIAVYLAHESFVAGRTVWVWVLGAVAVLFNPILPVRMHRSDWSTLDIIASSIFVLWVIAFFLRDRKWLSKPNNTDGQ